MLDVDHGLDFTSNILFVVIPYVAWGKPRVQSWLFLQSDYKVCNKLWELGLD